DEGYWDPINVDQLDIYSVGGEIFKPLLSFSNLVSLSLSHPVGFNLDDAVVRDMARAWPRIELLWLPHGRSPHRISPRVTLEGVYAFAIHCPRLQALTMTFDATVVPKAKIEGRNRVSQHSLGLLDVAYSPVSKPRPVATFLSAIFPHLKTIGT
ncbi:hypothetical protein C8R44DRAFT_534588, partial [Mycena epipterygia]